MSQDTTILESSSDKMAMLADAAWTLLENHSIDQINFDAVADMAGVDRRFAEALSGSVQRLVLAKMTALDRQSALETYDNIEDAGEVSIRERIIEGLLHRFETYAPYRSQIDQLYQSARHHPDLAFRLLDGLESAVRQILVMSGDPANGLKGTLRVTGVVGVFLATYRVWMKDGSHDLAATMKILDQRVAKAEEWGISLRVFGVERQSDDTSDEHVQDTACHRKNND